MKVDGRNEAAPARPASNQERFQEVLKKAHPEAAKAPVRPGQAARPSVASTRGVTSTLAIAGLARTPQRGAFASAEHLGQVRQGLNTEALRLRDVRGDAHQTNQERVQQRMDEFLARELAHEPRAEPVTPRSAPTPPGAEPTPSTSPVEALPTAGGVSQTGAQGASTKAVETPNPEARVQAALELIEKIEVFVKSQRPALAMRLGGTLDATVEVERTGEREVALRIQGRSGRFPQKDLARIRDALAERGLKLSAFLAS
ncbi:hypothetical protein [Vitiosangium sp. GDMCC 1.1324]|uniref:hypothetical protein n=1 Tax=Vitiosangium sp. (strain GDMCC 1.1324) TaxID=2138576 RepID=UPI000D33C98D|nr:hypothetical protein [Vitiosangium sp. GDMCC 1.1324]PTL78348.1 hypothetical protein DAT35_40600 [Vitiosangium sp. GDMCC 1.1324]